MDYICFNNLINAVVNVYTLTTFNLFMIFFDVMIFSTLTLLDPHGGQHTPDPNLNLAGTLRPSS